MSFPGSGEDGDFEGLPPMFEQIAKMFSNAGPVNWDLARQMAQWAATEGQAESNTDPIERIRMEELVRVADLHVSNTTGLSTSTSGFPAITPVSKGEWALRTLDAYKPLLERLSEALNRTPPADDTADALESSGDPMASMLDNMSRMMGPSLLGIQSGIMVGNLAQRAFGQYELPIPRPPSDTLLLAGDNLHSFADDWSLPVDELRLWVCLSELTHHAILLVPHVRERLNGLLMEYAGGFRPDPSSLENRLSTLDPTDMEGMQSAMGDPDALLGAMQTPEQRETLVQIEALVATIEGYTDYVMDAIGTKLITSYNSLTEALRRRRVETGKGDRFVERLFGLELSQPQYDKGEAFVEGIVERDADAVNRLWSKVEYLPTPAEIEAPGLWLARIEFA